MCTTQKFSKFYDVKYETVTGRSYEYKFLLVSYITLGFLGLNPYKPEGKRRDTSIVDLTLQFKLIIFTRKKYDYAGEFFSRSLQ